MLSAGLGACTSVALLQSSVALTAIIRDYTKCVRWRLYALQDNKKVGFRVPSSTASLDLAHSNGHQKSPITLG